MRVRSFIPAKDADGVARLLATSFNFTVSPRHVKNLKRLKPAECDNHRVLEDDGRPVAYLQLWPKKIFVGRSLLTMSGVGGVCTDPAARMKGYGRALLEDTVAFTRKKGYDFSILYGIPNFYDKYGYEVVMASYQINIAQDDLPHREGALPVSAIKKSDLPALCRFYNRNTRFYDGNCVRLSMSKPQNGFKLTDAKGRIAAYAAWAERDGSMVVHEAIARDAASADALARQLRRVAWNQAFVHVTIRMPFGYPATDVLRSSTATFQRRITRRKGCMGQVTNLPSLVSRMQPEWDSLLAKSEFADRAGSLAVSIGPDTLDIRFARGRLSSKLTSSRAASSLSPQRFAQMVLGYRGMRDLAADPDAKIARPDRRLMEVLFPERNSFLFELDKF